MARKMLLILLHDLVPPEVVNLEKNGANRNLPLA